MSKYSVDNINFDALRRNCVYKTGKLNPDVDKIIKAGTEKRINPVYIMRSF